MQKNNISSIGPISKIKTTVLSIGIAYLLSLVLLLFLALIVTYTSFDENFSKYAVNIISGISCITAGLLSARHISSRGYLHGGITAFFYRLFLIFAGGVFFNAAGFGIKILFSLIIAFFLGAVGGIIGINSTK